MTTMTNRVESESSKDSNSDISSKAISDCNSTIRSLLINDSSDSVSLPFVMATREMWEVVGQNRHRFDE